ncbi:MAG: hypothetical protein HOF71_05390 [Chloroflexi bacterium]|nr:hypothetical protein [Chloroflexota bacterium]
MREERFGGGTPCSERSQSHDQNVGGHSRLRLLSLWDRRGDAGLAPRRRHSPRGLADGRIRRARHGGVDPEGNRSCHYGEAGGVAVTSTEVPTHDWVTLTKLAENLTDENVIVG